MAETIRHSCLLEMWEMCSWCRGLTAALANVRGLAWLRGAAVSQPPNWAVSQWSSLPCVRAA